MEEPLTNPKKIWYTGGSSFVLDGERRARYDVVSNHETIEAKPLPLGTSAEFTESIALTWDLELGKRKRVTIYDSKYAFLVPQIHAAMESKGPLTTQGATDHSRVPSQVW